MWCYYHPTLLNIIYLLFQQLVLEDILEDMLDFYFYHYYLFLHILTNTKFKYVTSTYYHSWYLVFEFTFSITYFIELLIFSVGVGIYCIKH